MWQYQRTDELYHFGVLGMRWGHRRYQNKDGSLTKEGKRRYNDYINKYDSLKKYENNMHNSGNKLISMNKQLSSDFGGKHENVDDHEFFSNIAKKYKMDTKQYDKDVNNYNNYKRSNQKSIDKGKKMINKMLKTDIKNINKTFKKYKRNPNNKTYQQYKKMVDDTIEKSKRSDYEVRYDFVRDDYWRAKKSDKNYLISRKGRWS